MTLHHASTAHSALADLALVRNDVMSSNQLVYRRLDRVAGLTCGPVDCTSWLGPSEREVLAGLKSPGRRVAWCCSRVLAKQLILEELWPATGQTPLSPTAIAIHSRDGLDRPVRPCVLLRGRVQPWTLSIAHANQSVLVAVSRVPGVAVGVDLVPLENWSRGF